MVGQFRRRRGMRKYSNHSVTSAAHAGSSFSHRFSSSHLLPTRRLTPKVIFIAIAVLAGLLVLWFLISGLMAYGKIRDTNATKKAPALSFLGEIKPDQLQGEGDGRVNVLLIGIGGQKHAGGNLADTIMVASFDAKHKEVALLSIPRDLYVPIHGNGYGKINTAHSYGESAMKQTGGGPAVLKKTVGEILDLPIHYYVRVDFIALQKIVDALGGVTVDVEKPIVDLAYPADNMIDYSPFRLAAGVQKLDGKTALRYARSRHASGSEGSDFARARRQQKLIAAIKDKALSAGILANPKKINDLIGILGNHVKTDISLKETERFIQLWRDIDSSKIVSKVLDNGPGGPLISESGDARGYILVPRTGDFSEVQQIAHEIFTDPYLRQEKANIALINATGSPATGQQVIKLLKSYGYIVTDITPTNISKKAKTELIDYTSQKPYTRQFLESRFKTKATIRRDQSQSYDLQLTIGSDYKPPVFKQIKPTPKATPTVKSSSSPSVSVTSPSPTASVGPTTSTGE